MKIYAYILTCAIALIGLYFHVEYSGWLLAVGILGLLCL